MFCNVSFDAKEKRTWYDILQHTSVLTNIVFEDESLQRYQGIQ